VITAGAPAATDQCANTFAVNADFTLADGPWPPSPTAVPNTVTCGTQRPGFNVGPAIAADGTIYTVSRAHFLSREGFLVAVNPNLTPKWKASLRNRFRDGCGVPISLGGTLPPNGAPGGCRVGANYGVDPATNSYGGGRVLDDSSSTPVIAPDGSIYYGSYTRYNYAQGHMMRFSSTGAYLGAYFFGWDITPGIWAHGGTHSVATKDNHYGEVGSYCDDEAFCPADESGRAYPEGYFVTQLSPTVRADALADRGDKVMTVEWTYKNTNTKSCSRDANDNITCEETHPAGFEWCINGFVIDGNGTYYANSEDGWLFKIQQGGIVNTAPGCGTTVFACGGKIFQQLALGAAYTPTSIDSAGRIYSQNAGHLFVAGNSRVSTWTGPPAGGPVPALLPHAASGGTLHASPNSNNKGVLPMSRFCAVAFVVVSVVVGRVWSGEGCWVNHHNPGEYSAGYQPGDLALADFNNDGYLDVALQNRPQAIVTILLGSASGFTAAPPVTLATWSQTNVATGDMNKDGKPDLIVSHGWGENFTIHGAVNVFLGKGDGTFLPKIAYEVFQNPGDVVVRDFDKDGKLDVAAIKDSAFVLLLGLATARWSRSPTRRSRPTPTTPMVPMRSRPATSMRTESSTSRSRSGSPRTSTSSSATGTGRSSARPRSSPTPMRSSSR
jgi:hypothetical protein